MSRKYFGTDGIRGLVGEHPITPDFVIKLGWAVGHYFAMKNPGQNNTVIIGKDTRISGYMFESALEAGLVAAGVNVKLLGPMPTPAIAYLTRTFHAQAGVVISASHNPYYDNGIKFFSSAGAKLDDDVEAAIESYLDMPIKTVSSDKLGKVSRISDAGGRYIEFCKSTVPLDFSLRGLRIVVDCANGATYHVAGEVFSELEADVITMGVEPNGLNINEGVGSTSPEALQRRVIEEKADLGIAFDGDGDRVFFVDNEGELIDGDELLYIIASQKNPDHKGFGGVVGTLMTNMGIELAIRGLGMQFSRAAVGDRYVKSMMQDNGWLLGGESSGHLICGDVTTTGDGIISALKVLESIKQSGKTLREILNGIRKFPQLMVNVPVKDKKAISQHDDVKRAVVEVEKLLDGKGRVLLRPSGTESLVRVMIEANDADLVDTLVNQLVQVVKHAGK